MKKFLISAFALCCSTAMQAQSTTTDWVSTGYDRMTLKFTDGTREEIPLTDNVVIIPQGRQFIIKIKGVPYTYDRNKVQSITYHEQLVDEIDDVQEDTDIRINENTVVFNGLQNDNTVHVYSADGRLLLTTVASPNDNRINLSQLPRGMYMVKQGSKTYKIIVK